MSALEALQDCLAAEYAAIYGYGVLGGVLAGTAPGSQDQADADSSYVVHRRRRDDLVELISRLQADPVAAEPAYRTPFPVTDTSDCRRLARLLEQRTAAVYAAAVAQTVEDEREMSLHALTDCAIRAVAWGADPEAFPGIDEL